MTYNDEQFIKLSRGLLVAAPFNLLSAETDFLLIQFLRTKVSRCKWIINRDFFFLFCSPFHFELEK